MLKLLSAAALAACLVVPHAYADDATPEPCKGLEASRAVTKQITEKKGLGYVDLDGQAAMALLDFINKTGDPTTYASEHVTVVLVPEADRAIIILADSSCGGLGSYFRINMKLFSDAYQAARGTGM